MTKKWLTTPENTPLHQVSAKSVLGHENRGEGPQSDLSVFSIRNSRTSPKNTPLHQILVKSIFLGFASDTLIGGTKFGTQNSFLTVRTISDKNPMILKIADLSVFSRIYIPRLKFSEQAAKTTSETQVLLK